MIAFFPIEWAGPHANPPRHKRATLQILIVFAMECLAAMIHLH